MKRIGIEKLNIYQPIGLYVECEIFDGSALVFFLQPGSWRLNGSWPSSRGRVQMVENGDLRQTMDGCDLPQVSTAWIIHGLCMNYSWIML